MIKNFATYHSYALVFFLSGINFCEAMEKSTEEQHQKNSKLWLECGKRPYVEQMQTIRELVQSGATINSQHDPLHMAVQKDNLPVVKYFISQGADVNQITPYKSSASRSPLTYATSPEMVQLLEKHGAKIHSHYGEASYKQEIDTLRNQSK